MNKISQTVMESSSKFDIVDYALAWKITKLSKIDQHHEDCSWRQASMLCDCAMVQSTIEVRKHDKEVFLQSQIKVIEAVIEEIRERNKFTLQELTEAQNDAYGQALEDQISSLNQVKEEIKNILK